MPLLQGQTLIRIYLVRVCPFFILLCPISAFGENDVALNLQAKTSAIKAIGKENVFDAFDLLIEGVKTNFGSKNIESETKPFKIIDENFRINEEIESMITRLENDDFLNEETDINIDK